jgi:hypothetical protein
MNTKECSRKGPWPILRYYTGRCQAGLRKTTKALARNFVIPSKMRTGNFLNKFGSIAEEADFIHRGAEENGTKRQEVTKI